MNAERLQNWTVSLLRMAVGWHFLYEGLVKLVNPGWSAAGYLSNANWIFAEGFKYLAANPDLLTAINYINIWALILAGAALMLGIGIRVASATGILLLLLYYTVNPSLIGFQYNSTSSEGSYLIVNKNIIEALVLMVIFLYPLSKQVGLHLLFRNPGKKKKPESDGTLLSKAAASGASETRRTLLQSLFVLPVAGMFGYAFLKKKSTITIDAYTGATTLLAPDKSVAELTKDKLFSGKIGEVDVSRLILGGGCLTGWQHARDLKYVDELASTYNTRQRIGNTLKMANELGITTVNIYAQQLPVVQQFIKNTDNNLNLMVAVAVNKDNYYSETDQALKAGASLIYIQPNVADRLVYYNETEVIARAMQYIRKAGLPAGIGCYSANTVEVCEKTGLTPDFYVKSIHPDNYWSANPVEFRHEFEPAFRRFYPEHHRFHDNIFDLFPERTTSVMSRISVPWVGFKTLASGAVPANEGFRFAFENGADFISAGMFDFQMERNIKVLLAAINSTGNRKRKWYA